MCVQISLVHSVLVLGQAGAGVYISCMCVCVCVDVCFPVKQRKAYSPPLSFPSLRFALSLYHPPSIYLSIYLEYIFTHLGYACFFIHLAFVQKLVKIQEDRINCCTVTQKKR